MNKTFFRKGDIVEMTEKAIEQGFNSGNKKYSPGCTGVVMSDQKGSLMLVRREGRVQASRYHASFWKLIY